MKRPFHALICACSLPVGSWAQPADIPVTLSFSKADVREILGYYQRLTQQPVFIGLDVAGVVNIQSEQPSPAAALEFIRKALLEQCGLKVSTGGKGETLVARVTEPKLKPRNDAQTPAGEQKPDANRRVRVKAK